MAVTVDLLVAAGTVALAGGMWAWGHHVGADTLRIVQAQRDGYRTMVLSAADEVTAAELARQRAEVALRALAAEHRDGPAGRP